MIINRWIVRALRCGFVVGAIFVLALVLVAPGWSMKHPSGLPDSPEIPDLYDPAIVDTYETMAKRPYQVHGRVLAPWLMATVLTSRTVHVGPPRVSEAPTAANPPYRDAILVIGYVTDTRDGRIISLSETLTRPSSETRTIKAWVDEGWVRQGKGTGEWGPPIRSDTALTPAQTAEFMEQVYRLIQTGIDKTLKRK